MYRQNICIRRSFIFTDKDRSRGFDNVEYSSTSVILEIVDDDTIERHYTTAIK